MVIWNSTSYQNFTVNYVDLDYPYNGSYLFYTIPGNHTIFGWAGIIRYVDYTPLQIGYNETLWLNLTIETEPRRDVLLSGHVYDELSGEPIVNATIEVQSTDSVYSSKRRTNEEGFYQFDTIPGNLSIEVKTVYPYDSDVNYLSFETQIFLEPGEQKELDFYLTPKSSWLEGYILTTEGDLIREVHFVSEDDGIHATAYAGDDDGYYNISMPAGKYNISLDGEYSTNPLNPPSEYVSLYGLPQSAEQLAFLQDMSSIELNNGSLTIGDGQVVISDTIADEYDIEVGGKIELSTSEDEFDEENQTYFLNRSVCSFTVSGILTRGGEYGRSFYDILLGKSDFDKLMITLYGYDEEDVGTDVYIKINRDAVIDPVVRELTELSMTRLLNRINSITYAKYELMFQNELEDALKDYYTWLEGYRVEMLAYSVPVIAVGFYLGLVGIELTMGQKRRVLGILKSRGANDRQILASLMVEALVLGIIAGIAGLILGVFVSRVFLTAIPGVKNIATAPDFFSLNISTFSIFSAMFFAVTLMLLASIRPAKRLVGAPVIESMRRYSGAGGEKRYRPVIDIILVCFAVFAYIVVAEINLKYVDPAETGLIFTFLIIASYLIGVVWLPFSPFILMFSLTRLFTRGTDKVYRFFSRILKPYAGNLWDVIHKNIMRNPKRVSRVSIIIALALGFGVFLTTLIGTTMHGEELEVRALIGADLKVDSMDENLTFEMDLEEIEGVEEVVPVNWLDGDFLSEDDFLNARIALFNASLYRRHVEVPDYYFLEGTAGEAFDKLGKGIYVIIGEEIAQYYSLEIGSVIHLESISTFSEYWRDEDLNLRYNSLTVAGIVRALPGLEVFRWEEHHWGDQIYMDYSSMETPISTIDSGWHFLVDVEKGKDPAEVETAIQTSFSSEISEIQNLDSEISKVRNDMSSRSTLYIMLINIGFLLILITVGLALILFIAISERKNELATIMARGAETKQVAVLV
ncbi:MAG: ABC transporter permease, partial [Thermoplasmata archaeon]